MRTICFLVPGLLLLSGCGGNRKTGLVADKIYKENVQGVISSDVQILDGKKSRLGYGDYTLWVAFDCSKGTWESIARSKSLSLGSYSLDVPGATKPVNDTGFESLLGPEYKVFRKAGSKDVFFVDEEHEGSVRVVFFLRDW